MAAAASMGTEEKPSGCPVKHSVSLIIFVQKGYRGFYITVVEAAV